MLACICTIIFIAIVAYKILKIIRWKLAKLDFAGKTVFITGGSSGIGEALTKRLVELGAQKVIIASRNTQEMERVRKETGQPSRV